MSILSDTRIYDSYHSSFSYSEKNSYNLIVQWSDN